MKELFNSRGYQNAIQTIKRIAKISIYPNYPDSLLAIDKLNLEKSGATINDIELLLKEHYDQVIDFSIKKIQKFEGLMIEQEYSHGEEPNEGEEDSNEIDLGYSQSFLLINLIEFYLLKNNPQMLIDYLKSTRIPKAEKYARDLNSIYAQC